MGTARFQEIKEPSKLFLSSPYFYTLYVINQQAVESLQYILSFILFLLTVDLRCADKLYYRKRKEKEQLERLEKGESEKQMNHDRKRKRCQFYAVMTMLVLN